MVRGVPFMCIRTTAAPDRADDPGHGRVEAEGAGVVDDVGPGVEGGPGDGGLGRVHGDEERPSSSSGPRTTGRTRPISSSSGTASEPGRVLSPPTSMMSRPFEGELQAPVDGSVRIESSARRRRTNRG